MSECDLMMVMYQFRNRMVNQTIRRSDGQMVNAGGPDRSREVEAERSRGGGRGPNKHDVIRRMTRVIYRGEVSVMFQDSYIHRRSGLVRNEFACRGFRT
ncbi:hypothetical protein EVAR_53313_1 [Eumeta japonica]|uniref:Uncharacterized protein n=1 Tax=Eumeta variegata TaxID=151549 RepID=A0A4C1X7Y4_EUMVA|nr:hypothetical protein EVAR_53313_1 [Eumeta japonica]